MGVLVGVLVGALLGETRKTALQGPGSGTLAERAVAKTC